MGGLPVFVLVQLHVVEIVLLFAAVEPLLEALDALNLLFAR